MAKEEESFEVPPPPLPEGELLKRGKIALLRLAVEYEAIYLHLVCPAAYCTSFFLSFHVRANIGVSTRLL